MRMKKYIFTILLGVVILGSIVYGTGWLFSLRATKVDIPTLADIEPEKNVSLGDVVKVTVDFELPLYRKVEKVVVTPGKGSVTAGNIKIEDSYLWNKRIWKITAYVRPFLPIDILPSVLSLELNPAKKGGENEVFTIAIPAIQVKRSTAVTGELSLAEAEDISSSWMAKNKWFIYIGCTVLAIVIIVLIILLTKKGKQNVAVVPEWKQALSELEELRNKVTSNILSSSVGFAGLNDVVRRYLEKRFLLPATKLTTEEFLRKLEKTDNLLPVEKKIFLREFASAADLVKFAKQESSISMFNSAADSAVSLIEATKPIENSEEFNNKEKKK